MRKKVAASKASVRLSEICSYTSCALFLLFPPVLPEDKHSVFIEKVVASAKATLPIRGTVLHLYQRI